MVSKIKSKMISMMLGDLTLKSLTPSVNAPVLCALLYLNKHYKQINKGKTTRQGKGRREEKKKGPKSKHKKTPPKHKTHNGGSPKRRNQVTKDLSPLELIVELGLTKVERKNRRLQSDRAVLCKVPQTGAITPP
jgi:hypothetical protein